MESTVGLIYETVADPALWGEVTRTIGAEVGATASWMFQPGPHGPVFFAVDGVAPFLVGAYGAHYQRVDPLVREWQRRPHEFAGRAARERDFVDERTWLGSEAYNEFCAPNGIGQILTAAVGDGGRDRPPPALSFFRPPGAELFDNDAVRRYQRLLPHLQRAVRLREAVAGQLAAVPGWTAALLDQVPSGVLLLGQAGRVLHANAAARVMLDRRDGLLLRHGRLVAAQRLAAPRLDAVLSACLSARPRGADMLVLRPSGGAWLLSACPLPATSAGFTGEAACRAWVWVADPVADQPVLAQRLAALFKLTVAEQRVAAGLLAGFSPAEIAEAHGVSLPTVRTQVQAAFGKLGVRRQAELVRLLGQLSALPRHQP